MRNSTLQWVAILKVYADRAGIISAAPLMAINPVQMNLYRFVKSIGLTPLLCGIKGLQDPYRIHSGSFC